MILTYTKSQRQFDLCNTLKNLGLVQQCVVSISSPIRGKPFSDSRQS